MSAPYIAPRMLARVMGEPIDADLLEIPDDDDDGPVCRSCRFAVDAVDEDALCERCADPLEMAA